VIKTCYNNGQKERLCLIIDNVSNVQIHMTTYYIDRVKMDVSNVQIHMTTHYINRAKMDVSNVKPTAECQISTLVFGFGGWQ
jgi:hypothetical protein